MPQKTRLAGNYDQGSQRQFALPANQTFTQRLQIAASGRPTLLGLWLGNNQNPFNMRLQVSVNDRPVLDQTYPNVRQRTSDWAVPLDLSAMNVTVNAGDWLTFAITPSQKIGFSPVLVDAPDWPRSNLQGYGAVAARFFIEGFAAPKLHGGKLLRYPGVSGSTRYPQPALLLFALDEEGMPVVARAGGSWETNRIDGPAESLATLAPVMGSDGSIHLFGTKKSDNRPALAAQMDPGGTWRRGEMPHCKGSLNEFTALIDKDGCTRVVALDQNGTPHVSSYNYWDQYWTDFYPLKAAAPVSSLAAVSAEGKSFLLGIDRKSGLPQKASVLEREKWAPGEALPAAGALKMLTKAVDGAGNRWVIGLGMNYSPQVVARLDAQGRWHPGSPLQARGNLVSITAGTDKSGNVHVFGVDAITQLVTAVCRLDAGLQRWGAPRPLPEQSKRTSAVWAAPGESGDLLVVGCGAEDGQPFIAGSFGV